MLSNNSVVVDWVEDGSFPFTKSITAYSKEEWQSIGTKNSKLGKLYTIHFAFQLFLHRKECKKMVCWQQMHGIIFAFFCRLFHVKKTVDLTVMTFIYKEKSGFLGKLYKRFIGFAATSCYIDRIICYSKNECQYYADYFQADRNKFYNTVLGMPDASDGYQIEAKLPTKEGGGYLFAVGRSNRDYPFMVRALKNQPYKSIIADRTYNGEAGNCIVRKDVHYGKELYDLLSKSYCVIIPLDDMNISAGQTVFLQAMMFGKPIIVTGTNTTGEYVVDGYNGIVIRKKEEELVAAVEKLVKDPDYYRQISRNGKKMFLENFTTESLGRSVAEIIYQ